MTMRRALYCSASSTVRFFIATLLLMIIMKQALTLGSRWRHSLHFLSCWSRRAFAEKPSESESSWNENEASNEIFCSKRFQVTSFNFFESHENLAFDHISWKRLKWKRLLNVALVFLFSSIFFWLPSMTCSALFQNLLDASKPSLFLSLLYIFFLTSSSFLFFKWKHSSPFVG